MIARRGAYQVVLGSAHTDKRDHAVMAVHGLRSTVRERRQR